MKNLDYGVVGNCRSAALISSKGSIDWFCLPDFDSPSVFARLLDDQKGGFFSIVTSDKYSVEQQYIHKTNILITTFSSVDGSFELIDFMPRYKTSDNKYFAPSELYRYMRLLHGTPSFKVVYRPQLCYAKHPVSHNIEDNRIRSYSQHKPTDCIYLYSSFNLADVLNGQEITLTGNQFLLVSYNQKLIDIDIERVYMEYQRTKVYWLNWTNRSKKFQLYNDEITRSLLVLKIMSYQSSGAVLAALTTSLPEMIGEVRNWDYRFCWLRDASMSIDTLFKMGHHDSAGRFMSFIKRILKTKQDTFQIMYGIRGERELNESTLEHLAGYEDSRPVRIGNAAYSQQQNDVFGYMMNVIYQYYMFFPGTLDEIEDMWEIVRNIARTVAAHWEKPDKGIWEIRNVEKHFVFSKVMCWVAMDRAEKIARILNKQFYVETWAEVARDIRQDVLRNGWNESYKSFTQTYCNTDMIDALYAICKETDAKEIFDNLLTCANYVGLFSEDIDFDSKRLLGNFPQAYSHLALINTATLFSSEKAVSRFIKP